MKERPILFNAEMVRALLDGRKTQTRRAIKPQPLGYTGRNFIVPDDSPKAWHDSDDFLSFCPYGQPGDRLWVRETIAEDCAGSVSFARYAADGSMVRENSNCLAPWWYSRASCPSIHMPRWASRITLEIVSVRVERLQEISEKDALAEGGHRYGHNGAPVSGRYGFKSLWRRINGPDSWDANPWVWVVEFKWLEGES